MKLSELQDCGRLAYAEGYRAGIEAAAKHVAAMKDNGWDGFWTRMVADRIRALAAPADPKAPERGK